MPDDAYTANPDVATDVATDVAIDVAIDVANSTVVFVDVNPLSFSPVPAREEVKKEIQCQEMSHQQSSADALEVQLVAVRNSFLAIEKKLSDEKKASKQQSLNFESQLAAKEQIIKDLFAKLDIADNRNLQLKKAIKQMEMEAVKKTHQQDQSVACQTASFQDSMHIFMVIPSCFGVMLNFPNYFQV